MSLGVQLSTHRIGLDVTDSADGLEALYGTGTEGAVLIRPDGFIAWRSSTAAHANAEVELKAALSAALAR